jgi:hypothetical protein
MAEKRIAAGQQHRCHHKSDDSRPQGRVVLVRPVRRNSTNIDFRPLPPGKLAICQDAFFVQAQESCVGFHETASEDSPRKFREFLVFDGLQKTNADSRGRGYLIQSHAAQFPFPAQVLPEPRQLWFFAVRHQSFTTPILLTCFRGVNWFALAPIRR